MIIQCVKSDLVIKVAPHQAHQGILECICIRVQSNWLRVDHAKATPHQQRRLRTCHQLSGSYTLPCKTEFEILGYITTLSSVINGILEEKQCLIEDNKTNAQKQEQALATLEQAACNHGKAYCCNHKCEGHSTKECCGVGVPKEQQRLLKKKLIGKKKGKEKAHNTRDGGGGDSGREDKGSHLVKFKKCLTTNITNFSNYFLFDSKSLSSPNNPEV
jgi:hypothetical protein